MPLGLALLIVGEEGWRLAVPDRPVVAIEASRTDLPKAATAVRDRLAELDQKIEGVCLGLPADWILVSEIPTADLPRRQRTAAMLYRLEEALPIEAEQLTAAFIEHSSTSALGLAVQTKQVLEVLEALESVGLEVPAVASTDLLTAWGYVQSAGPSVGYLVIPADRQTQLIRLTDSRPSAWHSCPSSAQQIVRALRIDRMLQAPQQDPPGLTCIGTAPDELGTMLSAHGWQIRCDDSADPMALATGAAWGAADKPDAGWVSFRGGALAQTRASRQTARLSRMAGIALLVLALALSGSLLIRGVRYRSSESKSLLQQERLFAGAFRGQRVPPNIVSRFRSELLRLSSISGGKDIPDSPDALATL